MRLISSNKLNLKFLSAINGILIFILVVGLGAVIRENTTLTVNMSGSLEGKYYFVVKSYGQPLDLKTGDYVAFTHPWVPGLLIKKVRGVPGDVVIHVNDKSFVNEELIGPILTMSHDNKTLTPGPQVIIPQGFYFVAGDHARSFDSRYAEVGLLTKEKIYGKAYKLF
ncbi:MAG: signal peptidase I [Caedibacter sp. 37-49]|nr:MAG: signal peptidase I [Caedibacter sp. 37-49]